jgi:hypothetical protein
MAEQNLLLSLPEDWFEGLNQTINEDIDEYKSLARSYLSGYDDVMRPHTNHPFLNALHVIILRISNEVKAVTVTFSEDNKD